jgi:hypothetical protein
MSRIGAVVALCALPISAFTMGFSGTAAAATNVSCSKFTGNLATSKGSLSDCSDTANTGGGGNITFGSRSGKITWKGTGTTKVSITFTANNGTDCPSLNDVEYAVTGATRKSTGAARRSIKKGSGVNALVCVNMSTDAFTLVPNTDFTILTAGT